jgi:hypothetical protein
MPVVLALLVGSMIACRQPPVAVTADDTGPAVDSSAPTLDGGADSADRETANPQTDAIVVELNRAALATCVAKDATGDIWVEIEPRAGALDLKRVLWDSRGYDLKCLGAIVAKLSLGVDATGTSHIVLTRKTRPGFPAIHGPVRAIAESKFRSDGYVLESVAR